MAMPPPSSPASTESRGATAVTPERLMQFGWGFAVTRALTTGIELGLFTKIAKGARTRAEIVKATGASARGVPMLLDALVGLGLLTRTATGESAAHGLAADAETFLVEGKPSYLGGFLAFHGSRIDGNWRRLTDCVRTGKPVVAVDRPEDGVPLWHELVDNLFNLNFPPGAEAGREIARRHPSGEIRVLDVAAGSGVWGFAAATADARIRVVTQDLPETLTHARANARRMGLESRVEYLEGDLRTVELGAGRHQAAILGHICHSEGAARSRELLAKVGRALAPGGTIVIADFLPDADRSGPPMPLLFALNMLVHTSEGDVWPFEEYRGWLEAAGFRNATLLPAPSVSPLIVATRR
jgi:SAM-dependent methyltransferase